MITFVKHNFGQFSNVDWERVKFKKNSYKCFIYQKMLRILFLLSCMTAVAYSKCILFYFLWFNTNKNYIYIVKILLSSAVYAYLFKYLRCTLWDFDPDMWVLQFPITKT